MILKALENKVYPADYILSRLRLRKFKYGFLSEVTTSQNIWRNFMIEYRWLYSQMSKDLRRIFEPVFLYFEIKNIIIFLRYKGTSERSLEILRLSLLPEDFKKSLIGAKDITESIKNIEELFSCLSERFFRLSIFFKEKGLMRIENEIMRLYLESIVNRVLHPVIKIFIRSLIDSKNILVIHKYLRWQLRSEPEFISGGNIKVQNLKRILKEGDRDKIGSILYRYGGFKLQKDDLHLSLIEGIRKIIIRHIEDPLSIANILNYIWGCFIQAINLGINLQVKESGIDIFHQS